MDPGDKDTRNAQGNGECDGCTVKHSHVDDSGADHVGRQTQSGEGTKARNEQADRPGQFGKADQVHQPPASADLVEHHHSGVHPGEFG
jgi:hypothetical protein